MATAARIRNNGELTISNSMFQNNQAVGDGGALHNKGVLTVTGGRFRANAGASGGAIHHDGDEIELMSGNVYEGNRPQNCAGVDCGDIPALNPDLPSIEIGGSYTGSLPEGEEYDTIQLRLLDSATISVRMTATGGDMAPGLTLWDNDAEEMAQDENATGFNMAELESLALEPGLFWIAAWTVRGGGSFELQVSDGALPEAEAQTVDAAPAETTAPTPTITPMPANYVGISGLRQLEQEHGLRVTTEDLTEVIYPAPSELLDKDHLSNLRILEAAEVNFASSGSEAEMCFPDGYGRFFLSYWDRDQYRLAPLNKYYSGDLACVRLWADGLLFRAAENDQTSDQWDSSIGSHRLELIQRVRNALPNPIAGAGVTALCLGQEVINTLIRGRLPVVDVSIGEFSYSVTHRLYSDTKYVYGKVSGLVGPWIEQTVDFLFENTEAVYDLALAYAEPALSYAAQKLEDAGNEIPTDEEVKALLDEAFDNTIEIGAVLKKLKEYYTYAAMAYGFGQQAIHLPKGLTAVEKARRLLSAPAKTYFRQTFVKPTKLAAKGVVKAQAAAAKIAVKSAALKSALLTKAKLIATSVASAVKVKATAALTAATATPVKAVGAALVWAVIGYGAVGGVYDIIDGKHDELFEEWQEKERRIRAGCSVAIAELSNVSEENLRIIRSSVEELWASFGIRI